MKKIKKYEKKLSFFHSMKKKIKFSILKIWIFFPDIFPNRLQGGKAKSIHFDFSNFYYYNFLKIVLKIGILVTKYVKNDSLTVPLAKYLQRIRNIPKLR